MVSSVKSNLDELCASATQNCNVRGLSLVTGAEAASTPLLHWVTFLRASKVTGSANCLIEAIPSAIREGASCVALGLVRPALMSLRIQIDLGLTWLFFKDHQMEWERIQESGDGFKLKTEIFRYLQEMHPRFADRMGTLRGVRTRKLDDPYRLLSAHIHGQSEMALPQILKPQDIVGSKKAQDEFVQLQGECAEYVGDIFWSVFAGSWTAVPVSLRTPLEQRFKSKEQKAQFFG